MADRLPDELILAILEELAATRVRGAGPAPLEDEDVRHALVKMCLASRRLCQIAQPVLWRRVVLGSGKQLEGILSTGAAASLGQHMREYTITLGIAHNALDCPAALSVAGVLPNITELRIFGFGSSAVNPQLLRTHAHVRLLALDDVLLPPVPLPAFQHLEQLSLSSIDVTTASVRSWICLDNTPSLRILQIQDIAYEGREWSLLEDLVAPAVLAELDVVCTTSYELHDTLRLASSTGLAKSVAPPVLVHRNWISRFSLPRHTLFSLSPSREADSMVKDLVEIAHGTLIDVAVSPSALVVPKSLRSRTARLPDLLAELQGVEAQLATKGTRIIWYDDDYPHDLVPPEFLRYARELKAARRAREEEQEERRA